MPHCNNPARPFVRTGRQSPHIAQRTVGRVHTISPERRTWPGYRPLLRGLPPASSAPRPSPAGNRGPPRLVRLPRYAFVGGGLGRRSRDRTSNPLAKSLNHGFYCRVSACRCRSLGRLDERHHRDYRRYCSVFSEEAASPFGSPWGSALCSWPVTRLGMTNTARGGSWSAAWSTCRALKRGAGRRSGLLYQRTRTATAGIGGALRHRRNGINRAAQSD